MKSRYWQGHAPGADLSLLLAFLRLHHFALISASGLLPFVFSPSLFEELLPLDLELT